jgi:uncharacterized protein involved in high-affinity Fe2+ transport
MRSRNVICVSLVLVLAIACAGLFLPRVARSQTVSRTATAGAYTITLKVLPAESFEGSHAEMMRDSGADANQMNGPMHPNHHLVAFVKKDGRPVEDAKVAISYRKLSDKTGAWTDLPVVRMHMNGMGLDSTHYGNNVNLPPGKYEVRVTVNGETPVTFQFSL